MVQYWSQCGSNCSTNGSKWIEWVILTSVKGVEIGNHNGFNVNVLSMHFKYMATKILSQLVKPHGTKMGGTLAGFGSEEDMLSISLTDNMIKSPKAMVHECPMEMVSWVELE